MSLVESGSFCVGIAFIVHEEGRFADRKSIFPFHRVTTREVSIFSLLVQRESGQKEKARQRGEDSDFFPPLESP